MKVNLQNHLGSDPLIWGNNEGAHIEKKIRFLWTSNVKASESWLIILLKVLRLNWWGDISDSWTQPMIWNFFLKKILMRTLYELTKFSYLIFGKKFFYCVSKSSGSRHSINALYYFTMAKAEITIVCHTQL